MKELQMPNSQKQTDQLSLLYHVGISLASGKDLFDTLKMLQVELAGLIDHDAFFVAIYDNQTDLVEYPIFFNRGKLMPQGTRVLSVNPGLTGAVINNKKSLYLPDMMQDDIQVKYSPVNDNDLIIHTFLGVPLTSNEKVIGVLSVQSNLVDAYSIDQIRLMENLAVQAAISIGKARLLDQLKEELQERKKIEADLRRRESILEAITFSAEQFLKAANWREKIDLVLERLGKEFNASHAYLFEKHINENGVIVTSMRYEWAAIGSSLDLDDPDFQDIVPNSMGFERFYEILDSGDPLVGSNSFFTEFEKEYVQSIGVKALLEIRIVVNGQQWGTLGFDDVLHEREWTSAEVDVIKVAAGVLGAAIKRQLDEEAAYAELEKRRELIRELESKNEELERFTYTVSHDLKSPLVTINGFLGYLEQDVESNNIERHKKDVKRIKDAVQKMERLLNELLALSRIGRVKNEIQEISFGNLIKEAVELVDGRLQEHRVAVKISDNFPLVYGDHQRLLEVIQNLIDNAAKFMGSQSNPVITIGHTSINNEAVVFFVRDNGMGIAPQYFDRIFGLFNKLDPASDGTGVGLALVKRIIEIHDGRIWVESEIGQGTIFYFTLTIVPPAFNSAQEG